MPREDVSGPSYPSFHFLKQRECLESFGQWARKHEEHWLDMVDTCLCVPVFWWVNLTVLSIKNQESDIRVRTWITREVVEKPPVTSDLFPSSIQRGWDLLLVLPYYFLPPFYPQSSKTSMVNFGQLVASSAAWLKQALLSEYGQNITQWSQALLCWRLGVNICC